MDGMTKWACDVITEHAALTTTGGHVWAASRRFAAYLEHEQHVVLATQDNRPVSILELGSGCGWLGLVLARNLPAACICMTEQEAGGGLAWLKHNIELNAGINPGIGCIMSRPCDWNDYAHDLHPAPPSSADHRCTKDHPASCSTTADPATSLTQQDVRPSEAADSRMAVGRLCPVTGRPWDLILGADLIYTEGGCRMLPRAMRSLATPGHTRILYCHTKHRFDHLDLLLMEQLQQCGLSCQEVREQGSPSPPPSPPPLTELFPDMRIAVYNIEFCSAD